MNDSFSNKIIKEAERIKNADNSIQSTPNEHKTKVKQPVFHETDSFRTWLLVIFASNRVFTSILFLFVAGTFSTVILFSFLKDADVVLVLKISGFTISLLLGFCFFHFLNFKSWRKKLNFQLNGWEYLTQVQPLKKSEWRNVKINLDLSSTDASIQKAYSAALEIMRHKAQKRFYSTDFIDARQNWKLIDEKSLIGSANTAVTYEIYQWCTKVLSPIQKELGGLNSLTIHVHNKSFTVSTPTVD